MQLHYTDSGIVRISMSRRNAQRLLDMGERDAQTTLGISSGDLYRDGLPIMGTLMAGIASEATGTVELTAEPLAPTYWHLLCPPQWLAQQLALVDAGEAAQTQLPRRRLVIVESDEVHYARRAAGIAEDQPLPPV
jgi:hypothetical protein